MPNPEPFLVFTGRLESLGLRYMVSGSVAAIFYGEPRFTNDIDIILFLKGEDIRRLGDAFPLEEFYFPPHEVVEQELARTQNGHFNLIHHETGFKADIYLSGRDALHEWGLSHTVEAHIGGEKISFAPPEYVIIRKLEFFREGGSQKHLRDIHRMLAALGDQWPRDPLENMINSRGLQVEWSKARTYPD